MARIGGSQEELLCIVESPPFKVEQLLFADLPEGVACFFFFVVFYFLVTKKGNWYVKMWMEKHERIYGNSKKKKKRLNHTPPRYKVVQQCTYVHVLAYGSYISLVMIECPFTWPLCASFL